MCIFGRGLANRAGVFHSVMIAGAFFELHFLFVLGLFILLLISISGNRCSLKPQLLQNHSSGPPKKEREDVSFFTSSDLHLGQILIDFIIFQICAIRLGLFQLLIKSRIIDLEGLSFS